MTRSCAIADAAINPAFATNELLPSYGRCSSKLKRFSLVIVASYLDDMPSQKSVFHLGVILAFSRAIRCFNWLVYPYPL
jgi:hypothetical protein